MKTHLFSFLSVFLFIPLCVMVCIFIKQKNNRKRIEGYALTLNDINNITG